MSSSFSILEIVFSILILGLALSSFPKTSRIILNMGENIYLKSSLSENLKISKEYLIEDKIYKNLSENSKFDIDCDEVKDSSLKKVEFSFIENGETLFKFHTFKSDENWSSFMKIDQFE